MPTNNTEHKKLVQAWFNLNNPADQETYRRWLELFAVEQGATPKRVLEVIIHDAYIKYVDENAEFPNPEADLKKLFLEAVKRLETLQFAPAATPLETAQEATKELDKLQKSIASRYQFDDDED
jgi:hypothetical protein